MKVMSNTLFLLKKLLLKFAALYKRIEQNEREKWKKYCIDNYDAYCNADKLSREEVLMVFWKILKKDGYDISGFNSNTNFDEPANQSWKWGDLGDADFIRDVAEIFGFLKGELMCDEYTNLRTFGELAGLVIKKAKEKKLKEGQDKEEVR